MAQLFLNNCYGVLDTPATASDTTLVLTQMHGFPDTMGEGDWFTLTVFADSSRYGVNIEVVKVTAIDDTLLTVERGYEGDAVAHGAGERVEARLTADAMQRLRDLASLPSWEVGDIRTVVKHAELSDDWAPLDGRIIAAADAPGLASMGGVALEFDPVERSITTPMAEALDTAYTMLGSYGSYTYEGGAGGELVVLDHTNGYQEVNRVTAPGTAFYSGYVAQVGNLTLFSSGNSEAPLMWSTDGVNFSEGPTLDGLSFLGNIFVELPGGGYRVGCYSQAGGLQIADIPSLVTPGTVTPPATYALATIAPNITAFALTALKEQYMVVEIDGAEEVLDLHTLNSYPVSSPIQGQQLAVYNNQLIYAETDVGLTSATVTDSHELQRVETVPIEGFGTPTGGVARAKRWMDRMMVPLAGDALYARAIIDLSDLRNYTLFDGPGVEFPFDVTRAGAYDGRPLVYHTPAVGNSFSFIDEWFKSGAPPASTELTFSGFEGADFGMVPTAVTGHTSDLTPLGYVEAALGNFAWVKATVDGNVRYSIAARDGNGDWSLRNTAWVDAPPTGAFTPKDLGFFDKGRVAYFQMYGKDGKLYLNSGNVVGTETMEYTDTSVLPPTDISLVVPPRDGYPPLALHDNGDITFIATIYNTNNLSHNLAFSRYTSYSEYMASGYAGRAALPWPENANYTTIHGASMIVTRSVEDEDEAYATLFVTISQGVYIFHLGGIYDVELVGVVTRAELNRAIQQYNVGGGDNVPWLNGTPTVAPVADGAKLAFMHDKKLWLYDIAKGEFASVSPTPQSFSKLFYPYPIGGAYLYYSKGQQAAIDAQTGAITITDVDFYYSSNSSSAFLTWLLPDGRLATAFGTGAPPDYPDASTYAVAPATVISQGNFDPATQIYLPEIPTGSDHTLNYVKIR